MSSNTVTPRSITWAYRTFLRRNPESPAIIAHWMNSNRTFDDLVATLLGSDEFKILVFERAVRSGKRRARLRSARGAIAAILIASLLTGAIGALTAEWAIHAYPNIFIATR